MALYHYKAVGRDGETLEAERDAVDETALLLALQAEGLLPIRITPARSRPLAWLIPGGGKGRVSQAQVALFTRELLTLLQAGAFIFSTFDPVYPCKNSNAGSPIRADLRS